MGGERIGVRDGAVAAGVAAIQLADGLAAGRPDTGLALLGLVLTGAGGLALAARGRAPVAVLAVTAACALGGQAAGYPVFAVAYLVAVYAAVRAGHRTATAVSAVSLLIALPVTAMAAGLPAGAAIDRSRGVLGLAWLLAAAAAGEALRQAERRAAEAERTREQVALRRAGDERLHIARELHDTLTHQISVIKVQAEAAVHLAGKRGEPVPEALLVIRDAGREAARELRATLEALRDDDTATPHGVRELPDLVRRARAHGVDASLTIEGRPAGVPTAVDRAVYRIVQESLTNTTRHAAAATATVHVAYRADAVVVRVDDDGTAAPPAPPAAAGVGLLGMRERVHALGGRLSAGPRRDGGFSVHAELPVRPAA